MPERRRYPGDLSDARWELVEPVLTAWRSEHHNRGLDIGRAPDHDLPSLLDAVLYLNRTGIPWRYLPHDYPRTRSPPIILVSEDLGRRRLPPEPPRTPSASTEVTARKPGTRGLTPIPKQWGNRADLRLAMLHRRLARDYEPFSHTAKP